MLLESLSVEDVFFTVDTQGPDDCGLQMIASQGTLLSSYNQCGFTASHQEYSSVYEAKITVVLKDGRSREVSFYITCTYMGEKFVCIFKPKIHNRHLWAAIDDIMTDSIVSTFKHL